jgi:hypothetical protein
MPKRKTLREKLAERIKKELGYDVDIQTWKTTHANHWQRSAGACSSYVRCKNTPADLMFFGRISEYLKDDVYLDEVSDGFGMMIYAEKKK